MSNVFRRSEYVENVSTSERKEEEEESETVRGGDSAVSNTALISELDGELPEIVGDSLDYIEDRLPQTRWYIEFFRIFYGVAELCLKCYFVFRKKWWAKKE